ncbi:class III extradiol dioxygenase subunit B-like domain-containing protein [Streptosporangium sp. KLBMP 9127]|nr:class III extradiol dioxygenase subunit B-like domain-containing protein [Streptosporangium sp. KLBMP 9127]
MIVAAAVCPHPPLIVPELAGSAAPELDELRSACAAAVRGLKGAGTLVVVGGAPPSRDDGPCWAYPGDAAGSLAPWGADVRVGEGEPVLPLSLTVARWLIDSAGAGPAAGYHAVAFDAAPDACAELGGRLAASAGRVALLVMGDGSACLTEKSPGYLDPRAQPYDQDVAGALERADLARLAGLDPEEAAELWFGGRAAFQVLAAAARGSRFGERRLSYAAPYGVGYFVASWTRRADPDDVSAGEGE